MITAMQPSADTVSRHWTNAAVAVAGVATLAIATAFAAFTFASIDLRITMVVAVVMGIAATVAANATSQDTARGAVWPFCLPADFRDSGTRHRSSRR
jgi:hypothetical protein